ncbi:MAG: HAD family hydrolase [Alphaproteobacteria bacterium]
MVKIKAIIFDMDGVLVDARDWHYESLNKSLALFGEKITIQEHLSYFDGLPTKEKLNMITERRNLPNGLHPFINEMKQKYTMQIIEKKASPTFQHEYALSNLFKKGYKIAVASNSIRNTVDVLMDKCALKQYLEFFLSNEDVKKGKPDPEIYNKAISKLGFDPSECLIVEDNEHGIKSAKASGANVLKVANPSVVTLDKITEFINELEKQ